MPPLALACKGPGSLLHTGETAKLYVKGRADTDLAQAVYYTQAKRLNYM